jgi:predicted oxidoreductase
LRQENVDVVVIGAGVAGTCAAIEAAGRGARVTVVDTASDPGGTAQTAGGGTCIAGSPLQRELGIEDSPEVALADWLAFGGPTADAGWAERYLQAAVPQVYDRLERLGVRWASLRHQEGNRVPRWHAPEGGGRAVMRALVEHATRAGVRWRMRTRADHLALEGGSVVGVVVSDVEGTALLRARSVLVATGGFANDAELVHAHARVPTGTRVLLGGGQGARGAGHRMLAEVDAAFVNLDAVWMYPFATPDALSGQPDRGVAIRGMDGDIWVNRNGVRFHDEGLRGGHSGTSALLAQEGATCWAIIDAPIADALVVADPTYRDGVAVRRDRVRRLLEESPHVSRADSIAELARCVGLDADTLCTTVADHNDARRSGAGHDPDFGRPLAGLRPLCEPPYFAVQLLPLARKNLGGVRTDAECRVVDADGRVVEGLFAAGEVAGMAGGSVNGRAALEGTMLGPSLFSGMVAGSIL